MVTHKLLGRPSQRPQGINRPQYITPTQRNNDAAAMYLAFGGASSPGPKWSTVAAMPLWYKSRRFIPARPMKINFICRKWSHTRASTGCTATLAQRPVTKMSPVITQRQNPSTAQGNSRRSGATGMFGATPNRRKS